MLIMHGTIMYIAKYASLDFIQSVSLEKQHLPTHNNDAYVYHRQKISCRRRAASSKNKALKAWPWAYEIIRIDNARN